MDTIGKRIAQHRKRMGLTQDQLAEKLGITAQAISKWENDLSCPDITILPKLADIFSTTTDALLGHETPSPVCETTVVSGTSAEDNGFHYDGDSGKIDLHWDGAKMGGIGTACWVLLTGIVYLAAQLLRVDISFWNVLWPNLLFVFGILGLYPKFSIIRLGCALAGAYFLLEKLQILSVRIDSGILIAVLVLLFGAALLMYSLRKRKHKYHYTGKQLHKEFCNDYDVDGNTFAYDASFGESVQVVILESLYRGDISVNFGEYTVDLTGIAAVENECRITANCNFGELIIRIPRCYQVVSGSSTSFASFNIQGQPDTETSGTIHLDAEATFGQITVLYI